MKSRPMLMLLALMTAAGVNAQAASSSSVLWAASPAGQQPMPGGPPLTLLPSSSGAVPLKTGDGGKCLLVARRGTQIVAVELSPVVNGPKLVGWVPKQIDMNTLTSKWGYQPAQASSMVSAFSNPVTKSIARTNKTNVSSGASAESSATVTVNGKTYHRYTQFKDTSAEASASASDEYFCE
ncbi:hypothetical protein [Caballeronia humi]|uniref:SH3 domain-containing protein n=1 Tax=Caballeronia humi TaxID=326474 RepID=A0A158J9I5_9BURK|nr:hypothetical protein [Caballeronia humi]SAL64930.1 hypothetical protein AWB65_06105 [Caballeronia humi]